MPTYRVCGFKSRLRHQETKAQLSWAFHADVAQLVEHDLAKVGVAGSNPVVRSIACARSAMQMTDLFHEHGVVAKW